MFVSSLAKAKVDGSYYKKACETQDLGEAKPANKCQYPGAGADGEDGHCMVDRRVNTGAPASKFTFVCLQKANMFFRTWISWILGKVVGAFYISNDMIMSWHYHCQVKKHRFPPFFPFYGRPNPDVSNEVMKIRWKFQIWAALRLRFASMQTVPKSLLYPQPGCLNANEWGNLWGGGWRRQRTLVEGNGKDSKTWWVGKIRKQNLLARCLDKYVWYVCDAVTRQLEPRVCSTQFDLQFTDAAWLNTKYDEVKERYWAIWSKVTSGHDGFTWGFYRISVLLIVWGWFDQIYFGISMWNSTVLCG